MDTQTTATGTTGDIDHVQTFATRTIERVAAAWFVVAMHFGDRLGLYDALAEGAGTADEIAARAATNPRLTKEWLDGQVVFEVVDIDGDRHRLPPAHAAVLAIAWADQAPCLAHAVDRFYRPGYAASLLDWIAAQLYYPGSALLCTPSALSQGGLALGNQVPEGTWRDLFQRAGFTTFRRIAATPFNRVFEAR